MLLNRFEKVMMNNPVRAAFQRHFEARRLLAMGGSMHGGRALEIGCGRGVGIGIILDRFGADHVDAFDFDHDMAQRAIARGPGGGNVRLWQGDAAAIAVPDAAYDAVFDFGIIHHVHDWRRAVREVFRVLRPGGRLYAEEILVAFIRHPVWRRLCDHPMEDRFDQEQFIAALSEAGFVVEATRKFFNQCAWFVARKP
jgi:ubiquinone/menaquinone biosynthesis C-methylase UbiE